MIAAQDETYRDAKNIHSKYMRHQAFESEVKSNKDRLEKLLDEGRLIINEKPEMAAVRTFPSSSSPSLILSSYSYINGFVSIF